MNYRFNSLGCLIWGVIILILVLTFVSRAIGTILTTPLGLMIVGAVILYYVFRKPSSPKDEEGHTYVHVDPREQKSTREANVEDHGFSRDAEDVDYEEIKRD